MKYIYLLIGIIFISLYLYLNIVISSKELKNEIDIIENIIIQNNLINQNEESIEEIPDNDSTHIKKNDTFELSKDYIGFIQIDKIGLKKVISSGIKKKVLDKNVVGHLEKFYDIDSEYGNIVLAGHNNKSVFTRLHELEINDEIVIVTHTNRYNFKITKIETYDENDSSMFKYSNNEKVITLITCLNGNNKKRLVIYGILI